MRLREQNTNADVSLCGGGRKPEKGGAWEGGVRTRPRFAGQLAALRHQLTQQLHSAATIIYVILRLAGFLAHLHPETPSFIFPVGRSTIHQLHMADISITGIHLSSMNKIAERGGGGAHGACEDDGVVVGGLVEGMEHLLVTLVVAHAQHKVWLHAVQQPPHCAALAQPCTPHECNLTSEYIRLRKHSSPERILETAVRQARR